LPAKEAFGELPWPQENGQDGVFDYPIHGGQAVGIVGGVPPENHYTMVRIFRV